MAVFETTRPMTAGVRADARGVFASLIGAIVSWNDRRVTRNALEGLTSRELADIGLTRADIAEM
ncbi:uncharacterized protein YjiS (DUF1127 family) [Litoreibacter ponti]|uniref:Uncharacterized protein YjiS (DUF1127 family) n=1 Tax=Litoreibacter ponti TaxID=1510457 RepID=A0A2T6BLR7_9RHOB|nr:DUF1127 domain-containing protein [Litoreibacter ponti]PTX56927.1 uncharacterized protein YjiS (DUF1127 family) [Litoreibacter ponti]